MDALVDRAARAASRHPAPALRVAELARMVQGTGATVPDTVLLRALRTDPGSFRLIDPWRGPWSSLREDRRRPRSEPVSAHNRYPASLLDGPRLVPEPGTATWSPSVGGPVVRRMRQTMIRLGWHVDDASPTDLTRWHRLVLETARVREKLSIHRNR